MQTRFTLEWIVAAPSETRIAELLEPYLSGNVAGEPVVDPDKPFSAGAAANGDLVGQLSIYLALLLRWNAKTNLTSIRDPEEMVRRHFGESLFAGRVIRAIGLKAGSILDYGSGAGFPGLPIQLLLPHCRVTLAESQGKKAAFLREAVRVLGLETSVWAGRAEDLAAGVSFDCVALRAVDSPLVAHVRATQRVRAGGVLVELLSGGPAGAGTRFIMPGLIDAFVSVETL